MIILCLEALFRKLRLSRQIGAGVRRQARPQGRTGRKVYRLPAPARSFRRGGKRIRAAENSAPHSGFVSPAPPRRERSRAPIFEAKMPQNT